MQKKNRIIGFFFENGLHWQFEMEKKILQTAVLGCICIYVQTKHYFNDDRQLSRLTNTLGIPCVIWKSFGCYYLQYVPASKRDHGSTVVKVLCYKSEGRWLYLSRCQCTFHWQNSSNRTMAMGSTQCLTEMSTRSISWGQRPSVPKANNLPPSCAVVTKSGNLNFLEPFGPVQACNGNALPFLPASKPFDHAWFEVLKAITLYCTWSDNRQFQGKLVL